MERLHCQTKAALSNYSVCIFLWGKEGREQRTTEERESERERVMEREMEKEWKGNLS